VRDSRRRKTQADIERHFFEQFRAAYPLPVSTVSYGDRPDVTLTGERKIGIEVTRFYLQSGTVLKSKQRQNPLADAVVARAQSLYRSQRGKAVELHISFDTPHLIKPRRTHKLAEELAELAKRIECQPSGEVDRAEFQAIPEVSFVYFNAQEYPDTKWRAGGVHTVGLMSEAALEAIVREKEAKAANYNPRDAYWLLVVVDWIDPAQEQEIRGNDRLCVTSDVFEKIIIYKPNSQHIIEVKCFCDSERVPSGKGIENPDHRQATPNKCPDSAGR
jgi:hypothetical protein